jgi:hypothetical protein
MAATDLTGVMGAVKIRGAWIPANKTHEEVTRRRALGIPARGNTGIADRNRRGEWGVLNIKVVSWSLGLFTAISFVLCVVYGLAVPETLRMSEVLEAVLPAFEWLTLWGFCLGLFESFLYGAYTGLVFVPIYNFLSRRWGAPL